MYPELFDPHLSVLDGPHPLSCNVWAVEPVCTCGPEPVEVSAVQRMDLCRVDLAPRRTRVAA